MDRFDYRSGYALLIESYCDYLKRGELNTARGLLLTSIPTPEVEAELVAYLMDHLRPFGGPPVLIDWQADQEGQAKDDSEFRSFFAHLWELQQGGMDEAETQYYLERLNRMMQRREQDPATAPHMVIAHLPPIVAMSLSDLDALKRFLFARMEAGLPVCIFFREEYSELLRELQRCSDIIWALDEVAYPAEFYLMHPHGLRTVMLHNRRRSQPAASDPTRN